MFGHFTTLCMKGLKKLNITLERLKYFVRSRLNRNNFSILTMFLANQIPRFFSPFHSIRLFLYLLSTSENQGIVHVVRTQNFPKNQHFLPPDTHLGVRFKG